MPKVPEIPWTTGQRGLAWLSLAVFFLGFVLYMVGYTGNYWYVSPVGNNKYPPDETVTRTNLLSPGDDENAPIHFGLFYLCYRSHCKYDLRQDYQIVLLLPQRLGITWAYQNYRTACMAIVTIGAIFSMLAFGCYFLFLSGLRISLIFGYITGGLQILSAIISVVGVIIFGQQFYGSLGVAPFGWSFGLTIVGLLFFAANGVVLILLTVMIHLYVGRMRSQARSRTQSTGIMGCLRACLYGL